MPYAMFRGASIEECSFINADLTWADFRETKIINTDFTNAILDNTRFMEKDIESLNLSKEQLDVITVE